MLGLLWCVVLVTAKPPSCPPGFNVAGKQQDWCCRGGCPRGREWLNFEDICALSPSSTRFAGGWPPLCPTLDIATGLFFELYTFGNSEYGQCGITLSSPHENIFRPHKVDSLAGNSVLDIALGYQHSTALTYTYRVYSWGRNNKNQLGIGGQVDQDAPIQVNEISGMKLRMIDAGGYHACALDSYGNLLTWGENSYGQLGRVETRPDYALPVPYFRRREVVQVSLGLLHSCAVTRDRDVYCWGGGYAYQLGHNTTQNEPEPRVVEALQGIPIRMVACGCEHTLALANNGSVFAWGANKYGELGVGDIAPRPSPVRVFDLDNVGVVQLEAGCHHSAALSAGGALYLWGWNGLGQLGQGNTVDVHRPLGMSRDAWARDYIQQVSLGYGHTIALTVRNRVFVWGYGDFGQLGLGDDRNRTMPFPLPVFDNVAVKVRAGGYHSAVIAKSIDYGAQGANLVEVDPLEDPNKNTAALNIVIKNDADITAMAGKTPPYSETVRIKVSPAVAAHRAKHLAEMAAQNNLQTKHALATAHGSSQAAADPNGDGGNKPDGTLSIGKSPVLPGDFITSRINVVPLYGGFQCPPDMPVAECEQMQEIAEFNDPLNDYNAAVDNWYNNYPASSFSHTASTSISPQPSASREPVVPSPAGDSTPTPPPPVPPSATPSPVIERPIAASSSASPSVGSPPSATPSTSPPASTSSTPSRLLPGASPSASPSTVLPGQLARSTSPSTSPPAPAPTVAAVTTAAAGEVTKDGVPVGAPPPAPGSPPLGPASTPEVEIRIMPDGQSVIRAVQPPPSPSTSPIPPIPVDGSRNYISMSKKELRTRDQLAVRFRDEHQTRVQAKPLGYRATAVNATAHRDHVTKVQSRVFSTNPTTVGIAGSAPKPGNVADGGEGLAADWSQSRMVTRPQTRPRADDDAPILAGAVVTGPQQQETMVGVGDDGFFD